MITKQDFLNEMKQLLSPSEFDDFFHAIAQSDKKGLAINLDKMDEADFLANFDYSLNKLPYGNACYLLNTDAKTGGEILHKAGAFYLQEPSAMIPGILLPLKDGDVVLDACASPGGKTFQIARRLNGTLLSNEIDYSRAKVLLSNVERLGLKNVIVANFSTEELAKHYPNKFDCVLIDAPCSGEGMFRKEEYAITQWSKDYVSQCAKMQEEIIRNIDKTLKKGGLLVYSTCTFSLEENEKNVAKIVDMGYEIVDAGNIQGESNGISIADYNTQLCKRFYFHKAYGEGQFVALLKKIKPTDVIHKNERAVEKIGNSYKKLVMDFLHQHTTDKLVSTVENNLYIKNDAVYFCPNASLLIRGNQILSYGVKLGNVIKNRFEPCHNLFTAFGKDFKTKIELNKSEIDKYLKGETLNTDVDNCWCVVQFKGVVLGGGKIVGGIIKNHYPKGLRS